MVQYRLSHPLVQCRLLRPYRLYCQCFLSNLSNLYYQLRLVVLLRLLRPYHQCYQLGLLRPEYLVSLLRLLDLCYL